MTAGNAAIQRLPAVNRRCEQIGIEHIPLLASPQGGVAERVTKYREASADREAGVVFRSKTTPAAAASMASQYLIDDAATPPCGDARRGMALDCNSFTAVFYERPRCIFGAKPSWGLILFLVSVVGCFVRAFHRDADVSGLLGRKLRQFHAKMIQM